MLYGKHRRFEHREAHIAHLAFWRDKIEHHALGIYHIFALAVEFLKQIGCIPAAKIGSGEELIGGKHAGMYCRVGSIHLLNGNQIVGIAMAEITAYPHVFGVFPTLGAVALIVENGQATGFFIFLAARHLYFTNESH